MEVRYADPNELPAVMNVLDGALLATSAEAIEAGIEAGRVLVASEGNRLLGALVVVPAETGEGVYIDAIAVRPGRRGQGLGSALVRAATTHHGRLVAEFDKDVRPFWVSLGFDVEPSNEPDRYVGTLVPDDP